MQPNKKFLDLPLDFWANVKLLNQRLGYTRRKSKKYPNKGFMIPTVQEVVDVFEKENLDASRLIENDKFSALGLLIKDYMEYRGDVLTNHVKSSLMDMEEARGLFHKMYKKLDPKCPLPKNKQSGEKKDYAYLTGIVNMVIEQNIEKYDCDYDPRELTALTQDKFPVRTLSRRVDGAFPKVIDPIAIWEIKEYYYTTTFGSRIADGVYETQLDGWELWEAKRDLGIHVKHYLILDAYNTWWNMGKSYLCRIVDTMHMGLVTEVLFGASEVVDRLPLLIMKWKSDLETKLTQQP